MKILYQYHTTWTWILFMLLFLSKPMIAQEKQEEVVTEEELKSMLWDDAQTRYDYLFLQASVNAVDHAK